MSKVEQIKDYLQQNNIDYYIILTRNNSDHTLNVTFPEYKFRYNSLLVVNKDNNDLCVVHALESSQVSDIFKNIITYDQFDVSLITDVLKKLDFSKVMLSISESNHLADGLTYGQYKIIESVYGKEQLQQSLVTCTQLIEDLKSIKTDDEVLKIKSAIDTTLEIYEEVFKLVKVGMNEVEVGQLFVDKLKEKNVENALKAPDAPPMVCIVRCGLSHRGPSEKYIIEQGDLVIFDFSIRKDNFCSDIARTVYFLRDGETIAPADVQHAFDTTVKAVHETINKMKIGMKGYEVDAIGRKVIVDNGYPTIPHSVGHQVGLEVHDGGTVLGPLTSKRKAVEGTIRENEVYAIEPTVIQDNGKPCFIVEENVVLTKEGAKLLSKPQKELILL